MHPWAAAVAALLIFVILWDAFQTIILSRRVSRRFRPTRVFYRLLWTPWRTAAKRFPRGNRRENVLTVFGPLSLILLIALWALGLIVSFALLHWGLGSKVTGPDGRSGFGVDLYMSGTTFFTLGPGRRDPANDARPRAHDPGVRHGVRLPGARDRLCALDLASVLPPVREHLDAR